MSLGKTRMFYKHAKRINPLTYNEAKELLSLCNLTILLPSAPLKRYICDEINHHCYGKTNERSRKLKIKWLVSEARRYYNYGTMNPEIKAMVRRYFELKVSELKNKQEVSPMNKTLSIILTLLLILSFSLFLTGCVETGPSSTDERLESELDQLEDDVDSALSQLDELNPDINTAARLVMDENKSDAVFNYYSQFIAESYGYTDYMVSYCENSVDTFKEYFASDGRTVYSATFTYYVFDRAKGIVTREVYALWATFDDETGDLIDEEYLCLECEVISEDE
jgi:hypothetical protein